MPKFCSDGFVNTVPGVYVEVHTLIYLMTQQPLGTKFTNIVELIYLPLKPLYLCDFSKQEKMQDIYNCTIGYIQLHQIYLLRFIDKPSSLEQPW